MVTITDDADAALTKAFFGQWAIYAEVLNRDYMQHRGIEAVLRSAAGASVSRSLRLLDLGCGDARIISGAFGPGRLAAYTGIDLSPIALRQAADHLAGVVPADRCKLIEGHFSDFLTSSKPGSFDAVLIGYALHHLSEADKYAFFKACARTLADDGRIWLYDVFRRPHESRADYLSAYRDLFTSRWTALPADAVRDINAHIESSDFPETQQAIIAMASAAGFVANDGPLFADPHGIHCLFQFDRTINTAGRTG